MRRIYTIKLPLGSECTRCDRIGFRQVRSCTTCTDNHAGCSCVYLAPRLYRLCCRHTRARMEGRGGHQLECRSTLPAAGHSTGLCRQQCLPVVLSRQWIRDVSGHNCGPIDAAAYVPYSTTTPCPPGLCCFNQLHLMLVCAHAGGYTCVDEAAAAVAADSCEGKSQAACDSSSECVWCKSAAVPSSCFTIVSAFRTSFTTSSSSSGYAL